MKIKTVQRIYDDNDEECRIGDMVLLKTKDMDDLVQATIENIMTNVAVFIIDDKALGYVPMKLRVNDIVSLTLHRRRNA